MDEAVRTRRKEEEEEVAAEEKALMLSEIPVHVAARKAWDATQIDSWVACIDLI